MSDPVTDLKALMQQSLPPNWETYSYTSDGLVQLHDADGNVVAGMRKDVFEHLRAKRDGSEAQDRADWQERIMRMLAKKTHCDSILVTFQESLVNVCENDGPYVPRGYFARSIGEALENIVRDWDNETLLELDKAVTEHRDAVVKPSEPPVTFSRDEVRAMARVLEQALLHSSTDAAEDLVVALEKNNVALGPEGQAILMKRRGNETLKVFTNDHEWLIARSVEDCAKVYEEHTGDEFDHEYVARFEAQPPEKVLGIWCDEDGEPCAINDGTLIRRTNLEWCKRRGRGYLSTSEQ